jgi:hypothetical protein
MARSGMTGAWAGHAGFNPASKESGRSDLEGGSPSGGLGDRNP